MSEFQEKRYVFDDIVVLYLIDNVCRNTALVLLPADKAAHSYHLRRRYTRIPSLMAIDSDATAFTVGSLCHLHLANHPQSKGAGATMKHGVSTGMLQFAEQRVVEGEGSTKIVTLLCSEEGYAIEHTLTHFEGEPALEIETKFINLSEKTLTLEMLSSFSLDNLPPFHTADAPYDLMLHRFRGGWSLEGKHRMDTIEDLSLEQGWVCSFPESERFGGIGTHPVKRYFPLCALEDVRNGVIWGVQMEAPGSWQMELSRKDDCYSLSGGIADIEFGSWFKHVRPHASFAAPKAVISVAAGGIDEICSRLTSVYHRYLLSQPESEQELPIVFNEWCASWGNPSHQSIMALARMLQNTQVKYIIIDAGWTDVVGGTFGQGGNGDWVLSQIKFPRGIQAVADELHPLGFQLGIWFEFEVTTKGAAVYQKEFDHLHLTRNGNVIVNGGDRSFWDFRKPEVIAYLKEKVIRFIKANRIAYLKVDYNGSAGVGCDGSDSLGEGLREHINAVLGFFRLIRKTCPDLIIENCASGGHRLEPSFIGATAVSSFSDCHEGLEIPYIAANLQKLILPRQSMIWAVMKKEYTVNEIEYYIAAAFLGRLCLSGKINRLTPRQWDVVCEGMRFYEQCKPIIKNGKSALYTDRSDNTHHPKGSQVVVRLHDDGQSILLVCHSFELQSSKSYSIPLPDYKMWHVSGHYGRSVDIHITKGRLLQVVFHKSWNGAGCILK